MTLVGVLLACDRSKQPESESETDSETDSDGCKKDTDCKGDRICKRKRCVDPPDEPKGKTATAGGSQNGKAASGPRCTEEGSFCTLPNGDMGNCEQGRCKSPCGPGLFLYGGTHCAKRCQGPADCPGGTCEEGICTPLCPPACPYKWETGKN